MASGSSSSSGSDYRRKWDRTQYEELARQRLQEEQEELDAKDQKGPAVKRAMLKQRDYQVDFDSNLGKSQIITKATPNSLSGGYNCTVCDCVIKDSINFLDHINGKKHQRNMGMSMKVERSSLDQVKERFQFNKKKMEERKKEYNIEQRLQDLKEEDEKLKAYRKERRKEKKRKAAAPEEPLDVDPEMAKLMGFAGFGSTKKN